MDNKNSRHQSLSPFGREIRTWLIGLLIFIFAAFLFSKILPLFAWTEPSGSPPEYNVSAPINVSDVLQTKTGALQINGNSNNWKGVGFGKSTGSNALTLAVGENLIFGRISADSQPGAGLLRLEVGGENICGPEFLVAAGKGVTVGCAAGSEQLGRGDLNAQRLCIQGDCKDAWPISLPAGTAGQTLYYDGSANAWQASGFLSNFGSFVYIGPNPKPEENTSLIVQGSVVNPTARIFSVLPSSSNPPDETPLFTVLEGGRVGIGTENPGYPLSVLSKYTTTAIINVWDANDVVPTWSGLRLARGGNPNGDGDEVWFIGMASTNDNLLFRRNGTENVMTINRQSGQIATAHDLTVGGSLTVNGDISVSNNQWSNCGDWQEVPVGMTFECPAGQYLVGVWRLMPDRWQFKCCGL